MTHRPTFMILLGMAGAAVVVTLSACGSSGPSMQDAGSTSQWTSGSGTSSPSPASASSDSASATSDSASASSDSGGARSDDSSASASPSATSGSSASLPSAGYFELDLPFTSFQSSNAVTQQEEENAFQHVLFYIDPSGQTQSQVLDGNLSGNPVAATVSANPGGTVSVEYSVQTSSTTLDFKGTLAGRTMSATVEVDQIGGDVVDGTEYLGAGDGTVTFTVPVNPVSYSEIPQPPTGGRCGYSSDYGVELFWMPPSGGASAYDLFAVVSTSAVDVVYEGRVSQPGADDESELAHANDGGTMSYEIYSVSSNGLESLTPLYVTLTGLPGATAPICSYSG